MNRRNFHEEALFIHDLKAFENGIKSNKSFMDLSVLVYALHRESSFSKWEFSSFFHFLYSSFGDDLDVLVAEHFLIEKISPLLAVNFFAFFN